MRLSDRTCENCGNRFESKRTEARFCSDRCRYEDWDAKHPRVTTAPRTTAEPGGRKLTQKERILFELREAGEAGVRGDRFLMLSMPRYAARILELRQKGHDIRTVDDHGMARYRLYEDAEISTDGDSEGRRTTSPVSAEPVSVGADLGEPVALFGDEVGKTKPRSAFTDSEAA